MATTTNWQPNQLLAHPPAALGPGPGARELLARRVDEERRLPAGAQAVMRYFPEGTRVTRPNGGFVLWVQMPEYADSLRLYRQALQAGTAAAGLSLQLK